MVVLREAVLQDLPSILEIYNEAVLNSTASFDLEEQTLEERSEWFHHHGDKYPLIVAELDSKVVGYACLSSFQAKPGYNYSTELSVYIDVNYRGREIGSALMSDILKRAATLGYHTVISLLSGDNEASKKLHEKFKFTYVGVVKEAGFKFGEWQDVHFYQRFIDQQQSK